MLLDEGIFQDERLGLGVGEHQVDRVDDGNERLRFCVVVLFLEVTRHPFFQVLCLPHVDDGAGCVGEEVAAGVVGEEGEIDHRCSQSCAGSHKGLGPGRRMSKLKNL